jgi:hypothetical protein
MKKTLFIFCFILFFVSCGKNKDTIHCHEKLCALSDRSKLIGGQ